MLNEEDPVHAAIPPGRTAGRTAARTAVTAAFTGRVPRRQGTRGARRGTRPACRAAAYSRLRLAANQQITFHLNIAFRAPQALKVRTGRG
jgi:hypothetical protein